MLRLFEIENRKLLTLESPKGSSIAEVNLSSKRTIIIFINGENTTENKSKSPDTPTAFLIRTLPASITLTPSERYEPKIGM